MIEPFHSYGPSKRRFVCSTNARSNARGALFAEWQNTSETEEQVEIFYFLPVGWLARAASGLKNQDRLKDWWGRDDWASLHSMKSVDLAVLTSKRFVDELGYQYVTPLPIFEKKKHGGRILYYMVHGSDHPLAPILMRRAYEKALEQPEPPEQFQILFSELLKTP